MKTRNLLSSTIMALRTRFHPQPKSNFFSGAAERDEAYSHSGPYLLKQLRILLENGWKHNESNDRNSEVLFDIYKPMRAKQGRQLEPRRERLILPKTFPSFLDISKANTWRTVFENPVTFKAGKKGNNNNLDLYIDSSPPLSNIFYILQVLAPGMFVINHEYQLQDADVKVSRLLPRASWIESNIEVMSQTENDSLLAAANDRKIAFLEERTERPQNNSHHNPLRGTDALPAPAKDQKTPSRKKKKTGRSRNNSNDSSKYIFVQGYNSGIADGDSDWSFCNQDCMWCGQCRIYGPGL